MRTASSGRVSGAIARVLSKRSRARIWDRTRVVNHRGFAISPTVKEGYILRVSEDLLDIMSYVTGRMPQVFPITTQDITPYGNELYHLNSILQPCTATRAPVVGVALTAETAVPGCATGASQVSDIESTTKLIFV